MSSTLISALGFIVAIIFAGISVFLWRKASSLHLLLTELSNRYEESRKFVSDNKAKLEQQRSDLNETKQVLRRLEVQNSDLRSKNNALATELKSASKNDEANSHIQNKIEIMLSENKALIQQIAQADQDRAELKQQLLAFDKDKKKEIDLMRNESSQALKTEKEKARDTAKELLELKSQGVAEKLKAFSAIHLENKKLKKRLNSQNYILKSLRGLKEMSEERLNNWEVALRLLSDHVLKEKSTSTKDQSIGQRVGLALESIGAEILPESDSDKLAAEHLALKTASPSANEAHTVQPS